MPLVRNLKKRLLNEINIIKITMKIVVINYLNN